MWLKLAGAAGLAASIAALAWAGAAPAQPAPPGAPKAQPSRTQSSCFRNRDVWSWAASDKRTVNLRANVHDYYQLKLAIDCGDIDWRNGAIGLVSHGADWICSGEDVTVVAPSPIGPQRCLATSVRKLTPEEVAALPRNARP